MPESILVATTRARDFGRLDSVWRLNSEPPSLQSLEMAAADAKGTLVIGGGEPTLRPDFPAIVSAFGGRSVVATDGLVLHDTETVKNLVTAGLHATRVPLHSARADAHDWLSGIPGSHKRVRRAISTLLDAGVNVQAEVTLARPTVPYLEETAALLIRIGIRSIRFRMLRRLGPFDQNYVTTAPRVGLMEPSLNAAVRLALRNNVKVELQGLPHCAIPGFDEFHIEQPQWLVPEGIEPPVAFNAPTGGCANCNCAGAPADYVGTFGWTEFESLDAEGPSSVHATKRPQSGDPAVPPPVRSGRQPTTRVEDAIRLAQWGNIGGDPTAGRSETAHPEVIAVRFPPDESTRSIKLRLVQAAQQGASTLQIAGDMNHPHALELLRESLKLSFPRVVVTADLGGLAAAADNKLFQLRGIAEVWTTSTVESASVADRLNRLAKVHVVHLDPIDVETPVELFGPPGSSAVDFQEAVCWPQWHSNKVH